MPSSYPIRADGCNIQAATSPTDFCNDVQGHIARWEENLFDLDTVVADRCRDLDAAVEAFQAAVAERNRAADHLRELVLMVVDGNRVDD